MLLFRVYICVLSITTVVRMGTFESEVSVGYFDFKLKLGLHVTLLAVLYCRVTAFCETVLAFV